MEKNKDEQKLKKIINKRCMIICLAIFFVLIILVTSFFMINKFNYRVYKNVYLEDINLENMYYQDLPIYIKNLEEQNIIEIFKEEKKLLEITEEDIDFKIDIDNTLSNIAKFGREENLLKNNFEIFKNYFRPKQFELQYIYSEEKINEIIEQIVSLLEDKKSDDSFVLDEKERKIIITRGQAGIDIDREELKLAILTRFKENIDVYKLNIFNAKPKALDVDVVYSQVAREAQDAYIENINDYKKYIGHVIGLDFNKEELREKLEEFTDEGSKIEFELKVNIPDVLIEDIKKDLYIDRLSTTTTSFPVSSKNRASNVKLAAQILNETIVMPGEIFSFNKVVGDCGLASRGFKEASIYQGGRIVSGMGGGICQVSSTLYKAALYANLKIVKRSQHGLPVSYIEPSLDATIYYPYTDFKFENSRKYPIKIITSYNSSGKITVSIMGTFEETEYQVELITKITKILSYKTEYEYDSSVLKGVSQKIQSGTNGYYSYAYRIIKLDSKEISRELLSEDIYKPINVVILEGTKEETIKVPVEDEVLEDEILEENVETLE